MNLLYEYTGSVEAMAIWHIFTAGIIQQREVLADLFPRKHKVQAPKQISPYLAVDMFPRTRKKSDINSTQSSHVECVCLLSKKDVKHNDYVKIGLDTEDYYRIKVSHT